MENTLQIETVQSGGEVVDLDFVSRLRMLNKVKESTIEGNTRCVQGRGGLIDQMLFESEFISIMVGNLREGITELGANYPLIARAIILFYISFILIFRTVPYGQSVWEITVC